jgi:ABC-type branched-subunit amino acid transport system substrate-binding protein
MALILVACTSTTTTTSATPTTSGPGTTQASNTTGAAGGEAIRIGLQSQITGDGAIVGVPFVQGAELAEEDINGAGGIGGRSVELVIEDNETRGPAALEAADKLANVDGLKQIICGCFTILFFPLLEAHADDDVVFASNMSSSPELRNQPGNFASFIALDDVLVPKLTQFAWDQGNRSAGVLMTDDEYGQTIGPATVDSWTSLGGELVLEETLQPGLGDYRAEMQRVANANPAMLFAITYQADAVLQFTELEELGWEGDVYVLYPSATAFADIPGLDGRVYGIESKWLEEESADFRAAYSEANGEDPNYWSALGYDNVQLVAQAMAAQASDSIEDFFAALTSVSEGYTGPSGKFAFDEDYIQSDPSLSFLVLQDGQWVPVETG